MAISYEHLPALEHVYLEDSFVLGCVETAKAVVFSLELVLTPEHENYTPAKPDEQHCYRNAELRFGNPSAVTWRRKEFQPSTDASGAVDFGHIDSLVLEDGIYRLDGECGTVDIRSDPPVIVLKP